MQLIVFRPEYQLSVDRTKNRLFYQNFESMQFAPQLPHYVADWQAALAEVESGFSILSDMRVVNQANLKLQTSFRRVEQLIVAHGVRIVAEVHVPGAPTRRRADEVTTNQAMSVRHFMTIWEAMQFLDEPS